MGIGPLLEGVGGRVQEGSLSPVQVICLNVGSNLSLPLVPIVEQLLLVVQQFLMCLRGKLKVGALKKQTRGSFHLSSSCQQSPHFQPKNPVPWRGGLHPPTQHRPRPRHGLQGPDFSRAPVQHTGSCSHLHNGIHWAGLLAETTVDTFSHINVIAGGSPTAISSCFRLNCDCLVVVEGETWCITTRLCIQS